VSDPLLRFRLDYTPLMLRYLSQRDETSLGLAYELGRDAMRASIGLLDVVRVHHEIFLEVLATARDTDEAQRIAGAASALLMDLIASFEMSHRAFTESRSPLHAADKPSPMSEPAA
jgi:hypothetical protein